MAFPDEVLNSIKEHLNFPEIVSEYVQLKRSGRNFVGLCPFHSEKSPSFFVRAEEAAFHCFGCGKKGSVFNFIMEMRGFSFPEAVRYLAKQANVVLPEDTQGPATSSEHTRELREAVLAASAVFEEELWRSDEGRQYLGKRGVSEETARVFHLGYAPKSWEFILRPVAEKLMRKDDTKELEHVRDLLVEVGLLKKKETEGSDTPRYYDAFRERLIFPITRSDGHPVAFGGRALTADDTTPKYINSPESVLYLKRKSLFGIFQALPAARRERHAFLVEGNMDVVSLHQAGIREVVATCGTAVTPQHAEVLKRVVDSVTVVFNGDAAGRKAAASCFPAFLNSGLDVDVVFLPDGQDPDSAARTLSSNELRRILSERVSSPAAFLRFVADEESESSPDGLATKSELTPAGSGRVAKRYAHVVAQVRNAVEKEFLIRTGAEQLGVSIESIDSLVREEGRKGGASSRAVPATEAEVPPQAAASVPRSRPARPAPPAKTGRAEEQLGVLYRQLAVAVLCEPNIAPAAIAITKRQAGDPPSELARRIIVFLEQFLEAELPGVTQTVAELRAAGRSGPHDAVSLPSVQALLAAYNLDGLGLLEEAFRQAQVGGANPSGVLNESSQALDRLKCQVEVHRLQDAESGESDEKQILRLAQEKLEKRRTIEKLRPARRD